MEVRAVPRGEATELGCVRAIVEALAAGFRTGEDERGICDVAAAAAVVDCAGTEPVSRISEELVVLVAVVAVSEEGTFAPWRWVWMIPQTPAKMSSVAKRPPADQIRVKRRGARVPTVDWFAVDATPGGDTLREFDAEGCAPAGT